MVVAFFAMQILTLLLSLFFAVLARLESLIKPSREEYYLIGSNYGGRADPNALAMIDYLSSIGVTVIYVSGSGAETDTRQVVRGTYEAAKHFVNAKTVFYTHSLSDVLPAGHKLHWFKRILSFPFSVFLQHGVIGLKNQLSNGSTMQRYVQSLEKTFGLMIVSSRQEANIVENMGVPSSKLALTGLPRFDRYPTSVQQFKKEKLLVFFTWQNSRVLRDKVSGVCHVLNSFGAKLDRYEICLVLHQMQRDIISDQIQEDLGGDAITITPTSELNTIVPKCALLITDDSSVCWDVLYLGGQVLFYQSANDWLNTDQALRSKVSHDENSLELSLDGWLKGEAPLNGSYTEYVDHDNAKRVFEFSALKSEAQS